MAYVIDRVDLVGYLASDARVRDPSTGTLVVRLSEAAAYCLRETLSEGAGQTLHVMPAMEAGLSTHPWSMGELLEAACS